MNPIIGIVREGKIIVIAPNELKDGAKVRIWIDAIDESLSLAREGDCEEAKRQFFALTEKAHFKSLGPYPSRESLHDRD
jgi:hypothetical protein